jgi:hypothetical protein
VWRCVAWLRNTESVLTQTNKQTNKHRLTQNYPVRLQATLMSNTTQHFCGDYKHYLLTGCEAIFSAHPVHIPNVSLEPKTILNMRMYFNLPYHTDDVRKYKGDGDRRYVKQVFIRSAVKPHGETRRLQD